MSLQIANASFKKSCCFSCLFLFLVVFNQRSIAQTKADSLLYFLDKDYQFCNADTSTYIGIGVKRNGLIEFSSFTNPDGKLALTGFFSDSTLQLREGEFKEFDSVGYAISLEQYHLNKLNGYCVYLNKDYLVADSILYDNDVDLKRILYKYSRETKISRTVIDIPNDGKEMTIYYPDGNIRSYANLIAGTGEMIEFYPNAKNRKAFYAYTSNALTKEQHFNPDGSEIPLEEFRHQKEAEQKSMEDINPSYPGGMKAFGRYFAENMRTIISNPSYQVSGTNNVYSLVFWLDKNGKPYNLTIAGLEKNSALYAKILQILESAPRWDMRNKEMYGPVNYSLRVTSTATSRRL